MPALVLTLELAVKFCSLHDGCSLAAVVHDTVYRASGCLAAAGALSTTVHELKKKTFLKKKTWSLITLLACEA